MSCFRSPGPNVSSAYHGSALLASGWQRLARVLPAVLFLWLLAGWGLGWW